MTTRLSLRNRVRTQHLPCGKRRKRLNSKETSTGTVRETTTTRNKPSHSQPGKRTRRRKRRRLSPMLLILLLVGGAILALLAFFVLNRQGSSSSSVNPTASANQAGQYAFQVGQPGPGAQAPAIRLTGTDGKTFDLAAMR